MPADDIPTDRSPRAWLLPGAVLLAVAALGAAPAIAQPGRFGIGGQVGAPGGATIRVVLSDPSSGRRVFDDVTAVASMNVDGEVLVQVHLTREFPVPRSPVRLFAGPGFMGGTASGGPVVGVGAVAGGRFYRDRFEAHFQVAPRLHLRPDLSPIMGAGVGLRYFL